MLDKVFPEFWVRKTYLLLLGGEMFIPGVLYWL
jgi:hypothetical protein